jgi:hypothetical protein
MAAQQRLLTLAAHLRNHVLGQQADAREDGGQERLLSASQRT